MSCNTERTKSEAERLEQKFIDLLTDTQILFLSKESENSQFFTIVQRRLINCQLSAKFKYVSVVHNARDRIKNAANMEELFEILDPYWNWFNYDLLQLLVEKFGDDGLKQQLTEYLSELDTFEGDTSIADFEEAVKINISHFVTSYSVEVEMKLEKDPRKFTLRDIRNLKREIERHGVLMKPVGMIESVLRSSVRIILLYPLLALELLPPAMDKEFQASHDIVSITIRRSAYEWRSGSLEDIDMQVSVIVSSDT